MRWEGVASSSLSNPEISPWGGGGVTSSFVITHTVTLGLRHKHKTLLLASLFIAE